MPEQLSEECRQLAGPTEQQECTHHALCCLPLRTKLKSGSCQLGTSCTLYRAVLRELEYSTLCISAHDASSATSEQSIS